MEKWRERGGGGEREKEVKREGRKEVGEERKRERRNEGTTDKTAGSGYGCAHTEI